MDPKQLEGEKKTIPLGFSGQAQSLSSWKEKMVGDKAGEKKVKKKKKEKGKNKGKEKVYSGQINQLLRFQLTVLRVLRGVDLKRFNLLRNLAETVNGI